MWWKGIKNKAGMDMEQKIKDMITNADLVLIGIGEEFEGIRHLKNQPDYCAMIEKVDSARELQKFKLRIG